MLFFVGVYLIQKDDLFWQKDYAEHRLIAVKEQGLDVNLHRPEEGGSLHSLFLRCDPDLKEKQYKLIILSAWHSLVEYYWSFALDTKINRTSFYF